MDRFMQAKSLMHALMMEGFTYGDTMMIDSDPKVVFIVGAAINSDTLDVEIVYLDPEVMQIRRVSAKRTILTRQSKRPSEVQTLNDQLFARRIKGNANPHPRMVFDRHAELNDMNISGAVVRHKKGGVYTVVCKYECENTEPGVVYAAHSDGIWWTRSWSEFSDGRFEKSNERPLQSGELYASYS